MSKGYERWHCVAGHQPGLTCLTLPVRRGAELDAQPEPA